MSLLEKSVKEFLNEVDAASPAPGGGSVSALAIAQGISLIRMVGHLTMPKKKYQGLPLEVKTDYEACFMKLAELKEEVMSLIDKDTLAFNKIMEAFRLPKETEEEVSIRKKAINEATINATIIPLTTAKIAYEALQLAEPMYQYALKSAASDFGVGALLINAGLKGAALNVKINMNGFEDEKTANKYYQEIDKIALEAEKIALSMVENVNKELD